MGYWDDDDKDVCGTCRYHKKQNSEWVCSCRMSDYYSLETEYKDSCEEHEERSRYYGR